MTSPKAFDGLGLEGVHVTKAQVDSDQTRKFIEPMDMSFSECPFVWRERSKKETHDLKSGPTSGAIFWVPNITTSCDGVKVAFQSSGKQGPFEQCPFRFPLLMHVTCAEHRPASAQKPLAPGSTNMCLQVKRSQVAR